MILKIRGLTIQPTLVPERTALCKNELNLYALKKTISPKFSVRHIHKTTSAGEEAKKEQKMHEKNTSRHTLSTPDVLSKGAEMPMKKPSRECVTQIASVRSNNMHDKHMKLNFYPFAKLIRQLHLQHF